LEVSASWLPCAEADWGYLVTTSENATGLDDVMQLAAFADAIYANHWIGRTITPSA